MVNGNCAVVSCTNSRYRLRIWGREICEEHDEPKKDCPCPPPFRLHIFPSIKLNSERRQEWIKLVNRTTKRNTDWSPGSSDMVCSKHFVDGKPTLQNPNPTLYLGYEKPAKKPRRTLIRETSNKFEDESLGRRNEFTESVEQEHDYFCRSDPCPSCLDKNKVISSLAKRVTELSISNSKLQEDNERQGKEAKVLQSQTRLRKPFSAAAIKSDKKMKFFTGFQSILVFNAIYSLLKPHASKLFYWRGKKSVLSSKVLRRPKIQKLCIKDQFLLVLMRLRLGLLNQDLADRFQISEGSCSSIFATWIRFLSKFLGDAIVTWLPKDVIMSNLPTVFQKDGYKRTRCIIDFSEIYIERSKSLHAQACTWSDYKKHNTLKFLIAIAPSGYIMHISHSYGGRTSDQFICQNSGFYNLLEFGDEVMADRGFQIREDLLHHYCTLRIPPGARVKSQMTASECQKTKEVANLRIHVERAINRIKTFRILKNTLTLTMLPHADDIIRTCAAISDIQAPLIK